MTHGGRRAFPCANSGAGLRRQDQNLLKKRKLRSKLERVTQGAGLFHLADSPMSSQQNDGLKTQNVPNKGHDVDEESFTSVTQGIMDVIGWVAMLLTGLA